MCSDARRLLFGWTLSLGAALISAAPLSAQQPQQDGTTVHLGPRTGAAARTTGTIVIDGQISDVAWRDAPVLTDFVQRVPVDRAPATDRTEVRVLRDAAAIYVGISAFDARPDGIVPGRRVRDADLTESDAVMIVFDTFGDRQNGFVFGTNPAGIEYDGQVANEGQSTGQSNAGGRQLGGAGAGFNLNWDGSWTVATSQDERGWYAEFRIPFSTLRYGSDASIPWGFNVSRLVRRSNEESSWTFVPRQFDIYRLSYGGSLTGVEPPVSRLATLTPYALGSGRRDYAIGQTRYDYPVEYGADAKVQLSGGLTLDLTWNTDFAQVEVDDAQVNLSRFNLFFPEKRPFFLENSGFFAVGNGESQLFFSRRLGIANGIPVPLQGGGRLSGRTHGFNVGLLHLRSEEVSSLQPENAYSVVRVARELPGRSRVGVFLAERDAVSVSDNHNRTYAVDGQLGLGPTVTLRGVVARTETPGRDGNDLSLDFGSIYDSRDWKWSFDYRAIGEDFNPELGFLARDNYRHFQFTGQRYVRPKSIPWIREATPHFTAYTYHNLQTGFEESTRLHVEPFPIEFHDGGKTSLHFDFVREGLDAPFVIAPGITVAAGTYEGLESRWTFRSNPSAPASIDLRLERSGFLSGHRSGVQGGIFFRRGATWVAEFRTTYWDIDLEEGAFTTTLLSSRLGLFFTPRLYLQSLVQYNDQVDRWSANMRFGWLGTAGTGLFLVLNSEQGMGDLSGPLNRSVILKYSQQFDVWRD